MNKRILHLLLPLCLAALPSCQRILRPAPLGLVVNGDFQNARAGGPPPGWAAFPGTSVDSQGGWAGLRRPCAVIRSQEDPNHAQPMDAVLHQEVNPDPCRGQRVRVRCDLRLDPSGGNGAGQGRCYFRVDRPQGEIGFSDYMEQRPVESLGWTTVELVGDVAEDSIRLGFGVTHRGPGRLWVRGFRVEPLGPMPPGEPAPPRWLDQIALGNLQSLARAMGYLRYFHPSDEAANADWNRLATEAVRAVETAPTPRAFAQAMQVCFAPVAPSARFRGPGEGPVYMAIPAGAAGMVAWRHKGLGLPPFGSFRSERVRMPLASKGTEPLELDLGRGVVLSLPTTLWVGTDGGTLPTPNPPAHREGRGELPEPTAWTGDAEDRATRLAAVCLAWAAPQHFHPCLEPLRTAWAEALAPALRQAASDRSRAELLTTLRRLNATLKDGHGQVCVVEDQDWAPALSLVLVDGKPLVRAVDPTAASPIGGSEILAVDGEPVSRILDRLRSETSAPSQGWLEARLQRDLLRGPSGTWIRISYQTPQGGRGECRLERSMLPGQMRQLGLPEPVVELKTGIWYLDLDRLDQAAFEAWLARAASPKGVIFDLRGYPRMAPVFLQHLLRGPVPGVPTEVPLVTLPDGLGWGWDGSDRAVLEPLSPLLAAKVIFLADGGSASAAESSLATVREYHLGEILGERTAGANGQFARIELPCGMNMTFTGMQVQNYDGTPFNGVGITPDHRVGQTRRGLEAGIDELIIQAFKRMPR